MSNIITAKINYDAIDTAKLFKGAKGSYLDVALIPTPTSQYGDFMIVQSVTKEEREAGVKGAILGNAKYAGKKQEAAKPAAEPKPQPQHAAGGDEDVPF